MLLRGFSSNFIDHQRRRNKTYRYIYLENLIFIKSYSNPQIHEKYEISQSEFN